MSTQNINTPDEFVEVEKLNDRAQTETLTVSSNVYSGLKGKKECGVLPKNNRKHIIIKTTKRRIYTQLLQLKDDLEKYIEISQFKEELNFGYFLNEYIRRQYKSDIQFAVEMGVSDTAISQYLNHHRKPTKKFIIRLELHSNGIFPAIAWFKLLQKEKEYEIITDAGIRIIESRYVKSRLYLPMKSHPSNGYR